MNIAIAGYGIEGEANYRYWHQKGASITILDERDSLPVAIPHDATCILGEHAFDNLGEYDMVVRSAGVPPRKLSSAQKIWSGTNEFFAQCPAQIIGVTGTKGKGTTSSLLHSILAKAGKTVHLVGNIGVPALDLLKTITAADIVIYELSSFQLWDIEYSPHIAIVLPIEPDHLDVHSSFEEYVAAKTRIRTYQTDADSCVYYPNNRYSEAIADSSSRGKRIAYTSEQDDAVYVKDDKFMRNGVDIASVSALQLPGAHNVQNACAAITVAMMFTQNQTAITEDLQAFTGLPHRLKYITTIDDIRYFDDSISTTPGSAIAAIHAFTEPKVIILGGSDKGADYDELLKLCQQQNVKVVATGETGKDIYEYCQEVGVVSEYVEEQMPAIVAKAHDIAAPGDVVVLSPASASFSGFKNYADRGDQFIAEVMKLKAGE